MSEPSKLAGKVSHHGAQEIKAPFGGGGKASKGKVTRGEDLRTGRSGGSK